MQSPSSPLTGIVRRGYIPADALAAFAQYPTYIMVYIGDDSAGGGGTDPQPCSYAADYANRRAAGDYVLLLGQPGAYTILCSLGNTSTMPPPMIMSWGRVSANPTDALTTNAFTVVLNNTWVNAPPGRYMIGASVIHDATGAAVTYFRLTANGTNLVLNGSTQDCRIDNNGAGPWSHAFQAIYQHTGGDLVVQGLIDSTGAAPKVYTAGTTSWANGPYPAVP